MLEVSSRAWNHTTSEISTSTYAHTHTHNAPYNESENKIEQVGGVNTVVEKRRAFIFNVYI